VVGKVQDEVWSHVWSRTDLLVFSVFLECSFSAELFLTTEIGACSRLVMKVL